jgi:hypothetical protein
MNTITGVALTMTLLAAGGGPEPPESGLAGFYLSCGPLTVRVTDNSTRHVTPGDYVAPGYNGLASLIHEDQARNVFAPVGLNYECGSSRPETGEQSGVWNAPRVAPMAIEYVDERTVRLTQKGADAAGVNAEIVFRLDATHVDQTITLWPDGDVEGLSTFWASYMNLVQNTSLYLRGTLEGAQEARWLEMTSAGHGGKEKDVFFRPVEPQGREWHEFLTDNPVRRQAVRQTPESVAATEAAGFTAGRLASFDGFFFGFVDDYVLVWVFRTPPGGTVFPWISASGGEAVRRPAWDFGLNTGPLKAGERRTSRVRLVYKRYTGLEDVLAEVRAFREEGT